jgi:hypothetical protein
MQMRPAARVISTLIGLAWGWLGAMASASAQLAAGLPAPVAPLSPARAPPSLEHLIQEAPGINPVTGPESAAAAKSAPTPAATRAPARTGEGASCTATRTLTAGRARAAVPELTTDNRNRGDPPSTERAEPVVDCIVVDDDVARIEELRVRGQVQRIVVRPKDGSAPYEIQLLDAGRDPSAKSGPGRGGAGQRVWPVLSF